MTKCSARPIVQSRSISALSWSMEQAGAAGPRSMACGARDCQKNELSFLVIEVSINSTSVMGQKWK
jgi:hypothetical protein